MLLLDNREVKKGWNALKDEVCAVFKKHGAEVKSARRWDERRLAYPINHQLRATYLLIYLEAETQSLTAIRRDLEYSESVMRNLIQVCDEIPEGAFDAEEAFDESAVRVEDTGSERAAQIAGKQAGDDGKGRDDAKGKGRDDAKGEAKAEDETKAEAPAEGEPETADQQPGDDADKKEGE